MKTLFIALGLGLAAPALAGPQMTATDPARAEVERIDTEAAARAKLAAEGYRTVEKVEREDDGTWKAVVMKDNVRQTVVVHADGKVTPGASPRG